MAARSNPPRGAAETFAARLAPLEAIQQGDGACERDGRAFLPADVHPAEVDHDRVEPVVEVRVGAEGGYLADGAREGAEHQLLGGGAVAAQDQGGREEAVLIDRHQLARAALPILDDLLPDFHCEYSIRINARARKRFGGVFVFLFVPLRSAWRAEMV